MKQWKKEELEFLQNNYKEMTYKELSEKMNRTKAAIDLKINRLGLKKEKYTYKKDFFKQIDSEEKAYWLGFITADGCVQYDSESHSGELSIKLSGQDYDHLKKFNKSICGNISVTKKTSTCNLNGLKYEESGIRLYSSEMVLDLINLGVVQNKSSIIKFINIDDVLMSHFIRGYFDGNGCICISNKNKTKDSSKWFFACNFTSGSVEFLQGLRDFLLSVGVKTQIRTELSKPNTFRLFIGGMSNCDKFIKYIYSNSNICLDRKLFKTKNIYRNLNIDQRLLLQVEKLGKK